MSKCVDENKIRNPLTNRCIAINGKLCEKLLSNPSIKFDEPDIQKLKKVGKISKPIQSSSSKISKPIQSSSSKISKPVQSSSIEIDTNDSILKKIKQRITSFLKLFSNDSSSTLKYINDQHKKYCVSNSYKDLPEPIERYSIEYIIPVQTANIIHLGKFKPMLSSTPIKFEYLLKQIFTIKFNNYNEKSGMALFHTHYEVPSEWILSMNQYITSLSLDELFTVLGYSYHSYDFINAYLRGSMNKIKMKSLLEKHPKNYFFPFYIQVYDMRSEMKRYVDSKDLKKIITIDGNKKSVEQWIDSIQTLSKTDAYLICMQVQKYVSYDFWIRIMESFKKDLHNIIQNSPPLKKELVLYRGVRNDYFLKGKDKHYYKHETFVSCSLDPIHSLKYIDKNTKCCFKRITLLPGTRALLMAGLSHYNEFEVVLNNDTIFYVHEKKKQFIYTTGENSKNDLCFKNNVKTTIEIVDMIVSP
jgi:hypothetical protein